MEMIFNTKQDFFNYLTIKPETVKKALQTLIDTRFIWKTTAILDDSDEGVSDDTHRVIGEDDERMQQELIEDSNARLFLLGFTVEEAEGVIND